MTHDDAFAADLALALNERVADLQPIGGGDISRAYKVTLATGEPLFAKTRANVPADFFEAEADGLRAIGETQAMPMPEVRALSASWIALEWIETTTPMPAYWEQLGQHLATLHRDTVGNVHGYARDNYIGLTQQANAEMRDAVAFWRDQRLAPQLDLARRKGLTTPEMDRLGDALLEKLGQILHADTPSSLLHGDLWSGNALCGPEAMPFLIDPAVYHGPREAELALCHLFGGFDQRFFDAYDEAWPLGSGADERRPVYALYHLLNHLNLFGQSYAGRVLDVLRRYT